MKRIFKIIPLVIIALLLSVISCQHDDATLQNEQVEAQVSQFIIKMESGEHLRDINPTVYQRLAETSRHTSSLSQTENGTGMPSFTLDLSTIQIIERNTYTQYTTSVFDHTEYETYLINYLLLDFNDGAQYQFLIKYPRIFTNEGIALDRLNAVMERIEGDVLFQSETGGSRPCLDGVPEIVDTVQEYQCTEFNCTGGNHTVGEECDCGTPGYSCIPAYEVCGWVTVNVWECSGGGVSGTGTTSPTGGNGNDPNNPDDDDEPIETIPFVPYWQQVVDCVNDGAMGSFDDSLPLSTTDIDWLQSQQASTSANSMSDFIDTNGCIVSEDFIDEAVEALRNGGEVDFENEIIFKIEQDCAKDIAKKIVNNSSQLSQSILSYFNQDKNYIIKYSNADLPQGAVGATSILPTCEDDKCTFNILFNNNMLDGSTDLIIAKVILHETIHASLNYLFHTGQFNNHGLDSNSANDPNYKELVEAFTRALASENPDLLIGNIDELEHQYMTIFVDDMINTLKLVGLSMGYNENSTQLSDTYLRDLIWSGSLETTDAIAEIFTFNEQQRIHYRGLAELTNSPASYQMYDENGIPITIVINPQSNVINNSNSPCFPN